MRTAVDGESFGWKCDAYYMNPGSEQAALKLSIVVTALTGVAGIAAGFMIGSRAIVFDGMYSFVDVVTTFGALAVSKLLGQEITIEVDETSILDANRGQPPGTLVRKETQLFIMAKHQPHGRAMPIAIVSSLPPCHENQSAAFGRWHIVLGEGLSKRALFKVELPEK